MNIKEYRNKVKGCWLGKNIGGTLGAPFEGYRAVHDIDFYTQHTLHQGVAPNDDLDLQLVWLNAAECYGRNINASILGEYWLTYVTGNWSEYGAGKSNMANGLQPPLSGWYNNHNRNSDGAFIRSEIWACLMPGRPEMAVMYAYEDAIVDHFGEGVYGEIFTTAIESAAFVENDTNTLIDIGLSYIPKESVTTAAVNLVRECYRNGLDWKAARKKLLQTIPCAFGTIWEDKDNLPEPDIPEGTPGYDLPANIGLFVLGWLYGEGDFGKSICIAAGCGEDGDCTAATLGSILGIIMGAESLPEKWTEPIGDQIKTISLNLTMHLLKVPATVTELTDRVCKLMPTFLSKHYDIEDNGSIEIVMQEKDKLMCKKVYKATFVSENFKDMLNVNMPVIRDENTYMKAAVHCKNGINIANEQAIEFYIEVMNRLLCQQWLNIRIFMPDEWECSAGREFTINLDQPGAGFGKEETSIKITPHSITAAKTTIVMEIGSVGKLTKMYIPIPLFRAPQNFREIK